MICFRGKTFCDSDCENSGCHRHFGPQESDAARSWWDGEEGAPVAFGDFSQTCPNYTTKKGDK